MHRGALPAPPRRTSHLRRLRTERNLSLGQLAERADVSKMMLSQIERGGSNPTVNTLWKIANGLGVSYSALMESHAPQVSVVRREDVPTQSDEDGAYRLGCYFPNELGCGFEIYMDELDAGHAHSTQGHGPQTQEFLLVQTGRLQLDVAGDAHELRAGDAIHFDASLPHTYRNLGSSCVRMLVVNTYPTE